ncbi:MAG: NAD-dependent epimerase/dehydratase family protein, partial [Gammaproteobacteria bacterium]|nr:NAD-dependent epimerase/dehydratase family protein [Gammaproteobacteria bacterium]
MNILILGANGFIGSHLSETILEKTNWQIYAMDLTQDKLTACLQHPRFHFVIGDMTKEKDWLREHVQKCDVVLPLVAVATPALYVQDPLR